MKRGRTVRLMLTIALIVMALGGCAPADLGIKPENVSAQAIVLPVKSEADITREHAEHLRNALERQLSSSGFAVLGPAIVDKTCKSADCPERDKLIRKFPGASLFQLSLKRSRRANFVAGYYNAISGDLTITGPGGSAESTVPFGHSERGGLLFNTGQVLEAVSSTVRNFGADSFTELAERSLRDLAARLPKPHQLTRTQELEAPRIERVETRREGFLTRVCLTGTENQNARMELNRLSTTLRELEPGRYCGYVPTQTLEAPIEQRRAVISSDFGLQAHTVFSAEGPPACDPASLVTRNGRKLLIKCSGSCSPPCPGARLVVYRARDEGGPFTKAGTISGREWRDPSTAPPNPIYAVLAIGNSGASSVPAVLKGNL